VLAEFRLSGDAAGPGVPVLPSRGGAPMSASAAPAPRADSRATPASAGQGLVEFF